MHRAKAILESALCFWVPGDAAQNGNTKYERDCEALAGGEGCEQTGDIWIDLAGSFPGVGGDDAAARSGVDHRCCVGSTLLGTNRQCTVSNECTFLSVFTKPLVWKGKTKEDDNWICFHYCGEVRCFSFKKINSTISYHATNTSNTNFMPSVTKVKVSFFN